MALRSRLPQKSHFVESSRRALFIHDAAIGDFLVAARLMKLCEDKLGPHDWSYLGKPSLGKLAISLGLVCDYHDFSNQPWHLLFSHETSLPEQLREFVSSFELIVNLIGDSESIFSKRLDQLCSGKIYSVNPKPAVDFEGHVLEFQASQMGLILDELPKSPYAVSQKIIDAVKGELLCKNIDASRLILIHPGASGESKRGDIGLFCKLAEQANDAGYQPGVLLGEVELEQFSEADLAKLKLKAKLIINWPLEKLAALLVLAKTYVGNDNGISHLAGSVGVASKVLFVKQNWNNWQPIGPDVQILTYMPDFNDLLDK